MREVGAVCKFFAAASFIITTIVILYHYGQYGVHSQFRSALVTSIVFHALAFLLGILLDRLGQANEQIYQLSKQLDRLKERMDKLEEK